MKIYLPFNFQIRIYASRQLKRVGVCSQQYDTPDRHALMWDFDGEELQPLISNLSNLQLKYNLSNIYITESSSGNYHAYCFTSRTFLEIIHILSDTPNIDMSYLRLGIIRGYFTLRITPRNNEPNFKLVKVLASAYPEEIKPEDLTVSEYLTNNKGGK